MNICSMKAILAILFLVVFTSCLGSEKGLDSKEQAIVQKDSDVIDSLWICHHPGTEFHNKLCVEEIFPQGCYVNGDSHKFCWLLNREDCDEERGNSLQACFLFPNAN